MDPDPGIVPDAPTPAARARPGIRGTPVELAGATWILADWVPDVGAAVYDRLYDDNILKGQYEAHDVLDAAYRLTIANYRLTRAEAAGLLLGVPAASLVPAVEAALFGARKQHLRWSDWVASALAANRIDPATVPPGQLRHVLAQLVGTGRAVPEHRFISSAEYAAVRARRSRATD